MTLAEKLRQWILLDLDRREAQGAAALAEEVVLAALNAKPFGLRPLLVDVKGKKYIVRASHRSDPESLAVVYEELEEAK